MSQSVSHTYTRTHIRTTERTRNTPSMYTIVFQVRNVSLRNYNTCVIRVLFNYHVKGYKFDPYADAQLRYLISKKIVSYLRSASLAAYKSVKLANHLFLFRLIRGLKGYCETYCLFNESNLYHQEGQLRISRTTKPL